MRYIMQTNKLSDSYHEMDFGYVGVDLATGERHYYSMYDKNDNYRTDMVFEFDINEPIASSYLSWNMYYCNYKTGNSSELPKEIFPLIDTLIANHLLYNEKNNYPTQFLTHNSKNLLIKYSNNFSLFGYLKFAGRYTSIENIIEIPVTNYDWEQYNKNQKKEAEDILNHEVGHMKVSRAKLDAKNNLLKVYQGFYTYQIKVKPILLENGDIFLKFGQTIKSTNGYDEILEEVMNDFDCKKIDSSFIPRYPYIGYELNELCNKRLETARYCNGGIIELYDSLKCIINSQNMVDELLESIIQVKDSYEEQTNEKTNHMMKLLKKYQVAKNNCNL